MRAFLCSGCAKMRRDYLSSTIINTKRFCGTCSEGLKADLSRGSLRACDSSWREFEMFFGKRKAHSFRSYAEMEKAAAKAGWTPIGSKGEKPNVSKMKAEREKIEDLKLERKMLREWVKMNSIEVRL